MLSCSIDYLPFRRKFPDNSMAVICLSKSYYTIFITVPNNAVPEMLVILIRSRFVVSSVEENTAMI
jgi:hypothetical protein